MATTATQNDEGWDYECDRRGCGFVSTGWATKKLAIARGKEHEDEHETGEPMRELADFRKDNA